MKYYSQAIISSKSFKSCNDFYSDLCDSLYAGKDVRIIFDTTPIFNGEEYDYFKTTELNSQNKVVYYVNSILNNSKVIENLGFNLNLSLWSEEKPQTKYELKLSNVRTFFYDLKDNSLVDEYDIGVIDVIDVTPETVKPSTSVKAVERPLKEEFEDVIKRIGKNNFLEICSYIKYHGLSTEKICAKYDVTSWFINNVRQVFNFACDSRNDNIIKDFNNGYTKEQLMQKYNLKSSRIGNILKHYRLIYTLSKELF